MQPITIGAITPRGRKWKSYDVITLVHVDGELTVAYGRKRVDEGQLQDALTFNSPMFRFL